MRSFASDNNASVHPLIMQAVAAANVDHAVGYGDDEWTHRAEQAIKNVFGGRGEVLLVFNGTGANIIALQAVTRPWNSIICAQTAHIFVDECGAPARMTGCQIVPVETVDGKLTPALIEPHLHVLGVEHHSQPGAIYISQTTELGTVYTPAQVRSIADLAHSHGMFLHMDGARIANAVAALGCSLAEITVDAGVDILSFGGTKNGMMMGEAVVAFNPAISLNLKYIRKQSAQLASKMRYMAAQWPPYLEGDLWLKNAVHANAMAQCLADVILTHPEARLTRPVESNQVFCTMPSELLECIKNLYFFYMWNEKIGEARFVTSWDTTDYDIERFSTVYIESI